jgi:hypothetical protein
MTAERFNWQEKAEEGRSCFKNFVVSFLPLKDVLCVPLLFLEENDDLEAELAREKRSCFKNVVIS